MEARLPIFDEIWVKIQRGNKEVKK